VVQIEVVDKEDLAGVLDRARNVFEAIFVLGSVRQSCAVVIIGVHVQVERSPGIRRPARVLEAEHENVVVVAKIEGVTGMACVVNVAVERIAVGIDVDVV
jgi:hypothetical protein